MALTFIFLVVGFVFLVKGADVFVEGSSSIAEYIKIPTVIIGLTIVSLGTSAPEIAVSITAAFQQNGDMAVSNVLGSNIFNLLVVVGVCASICAFSIDKQILKRDYRVVFITGIALLALMIDGTISRFEGGLLLGGLIWYLYVLLREVLKFRDQLPVSEREISIVKSVAMAVIGIVGIVFGGDLVVDSATAIASKFGLSQNLIGLTIVAIGTSLPELATSVVAARKGESGLAIGNVVGSNIFNILLIVGLTSTIYPLSVATVAIIDAAFLMVVTLVIYLIMKSNETFKKSHGIFLILMYAAYMVYVVMR